MTIELNRRTVLTGIGAAATTGALLPGRAPAAAPDRDFAYRSATDTIAALANKKVSARELVDAAIRPHRRARPENQRRRRARFRSRPRRS